MDLNGAYIYIYYIYICAYCLLALRLYFWIGGFWIPLAKDPGIKGFNRFHTFRRRGTALEVLAVEYPGYGICPGTCDEAS